MVMAFGKDPIISQIHLYIRRGAKLTKALPLWIRYPMFACGLYLLIFFVLSLFSPLKVHIPYSTQLLDQQGEVLHAFLSYDDKWRMEIQESEISEALERALLHKEDKYFYYHPGINPFAILRAAFNNIIKGKRTSGASTITMQVARLLNPKSRTYQHKLIEMFRALQLEWRYSKKEILQLYLSMVPYGGNVEGLSSASHLYFHKSPRHLSLAEITTLVIIPNRPTSLRLDRHHAAIVAARNRWLRRFQAAGLFPPAHVEAALAEPLHIGQRKIPRTAPHLSIRLKKQYPTAHRIHTFVHTPTQKAIERLVDQHIQSWYKKDVKNAAAFIIDNSTQQVIAYVGSADFYNDEDAGQVDGITAIRSPGSTLKPLLYGMAFDQGLVTPRTIMYDVPTRFGSYFPENYDDQFRGRQTVISALANSLNVPAVQLLHQLGTHQIIDQLTKMGFKQIARDKRKLGLSLILGGCGTTLEELTRMYASFAAQGRYQSLRYTKEDPLLQVSLPIMSPSASYMLTDILIRLDRPDLPISWKYSANFPRVAWKTGTSYGRKDAWSIGYNPAYTVGVWVGNFSGEGVPELSGATAAAPLLFSIFNYLGNGKDASWFKEPEALAYRQVCSETGNLPEVWCTDQVLDAYIPSVSPNRACTHAKTYWISEDSSLSYCTSCLPDSGFQEVLYPNYTPAYLRFMRSRHLIHSLPPTHNPDCERVMASQALRITSPQPNTEYFLDKQDQESLLLSCDVASDVQKVYWYINHQFYKAVDPDERLFIKAPDGPLTISCTDDRGRRDEVTLTIRQINW